MQTEIEQLKVEIEKLKAERNRAGLIERQKYLLKLSAWQKTADELALYLDEYNKQAGESHEPLYWIACRALDRYKQLKEQTVAAMPNAGTQPPTARLAG